MEFPRTGINTIGRIILGLFLIFSAPGALEAATDRLGDALEDSLRQPFDGDFDAIIDRGYIRVLIPFSKTGFFIENGAQRGTSVELMGLLGRHFDRVHGKRARNLKVVLIPTPRNWLLIAAMSFQESRFDPKAHSRAGAIGLMQIKRSTAEGSPINIRDIATKPDSNIHAGVKYLRFLADRYFRARTHKIVPSGVHPAQKSQEKSAEPCGCMAQRL